MPNATAVEALLASRLTRSLDAWRERLDVELRAGGSSRHLAVVRLAVPGATAPELREADLQRAADAFHIGVRRHLGASVYVVELIEYPHQNQLALDGHLAVTTGSYQLAAL